MDKFKVNKNPDKIQTKSFDFLILMIKIWQTKSLKLSSNLRE
jgi:hypothetical protein